MRNPTRIGAVILLLSLVTVRFVDLAAGVVLAAVGAVALTVGLVRDRLHRRAAAAAPQVNWAEEFTARVRRERAAAAGRAAQRTAAEHAAVQAVQASVPGAEPAAGQAAA